MFKAKSCDLKNTINTGWSIKERILFPKSHALHVKLERKENLAAVLTLKGVAGTPKDLTDNVNYMAVNLTGQVRGIARVVTAVANGSLNQKLVLEAKGEIAELAETINAMINTLATFADQVTTVAREVGTEGKLGGRAEVLRRIRERGEPSQTT